MRLLSPVTRAVSGFDGGDPNKYPGAYPPPAGIVPDLNNPPDAGRVAGISAFIVCLALSTTLFTIRFYVKLRITRRLLLEDLTCLISWAMIAVITATSLMMIRFGLGHHSWDVSVDEYSYMLKWLYITSIVYEPAAFFTKVTLLLLLARVFAVNVKLARGIYIFIIVLCIAYIPIFGIKIGLCGPPSAFWDPDVPGECLDIRQIFIVDVAFAITTDSLIFIIPIPSTWKMRISWRKKTKITFLLGAGGVATAVTIYRLVKLIGYLESKDVASDFTLLQVLTVLELTIGLTCSCLPALNIMIEHHRQPVQSANSPRSGVRRPRRDKTNQVTGFAFNWLGTKSSVSDEWPATYSKSSRAHHPRTTKTSTHTHLELEHALSGAGGGSRDHIVEANETPANPQAPCFTGEKTTACDGRREGWLHSCAHMDQEGSSAQKGTEDNDNDEMGESKQSRDISDRLAELSGNAPWGYIWDGRSNLMGSSSHVQTKKGQV